MDKFSPSSDFPVSSDLVSKRINEGWKWIDCNSVKILWPPMSDKRCFYTAHFIKFQENKVVPHFIFSE